MKDSGGSGGLDGRITGGLSAKIQLYKLQTKAKNAELRIPKMRYGHRQFTMSPLFNDMVKLNNTSLQDRVMLLFT